MLSLPGETFKINLKKLIHKYRIKNSNSASLRHYGIIHFKYFALYFIKSRRMPTRNLSSAKMSDHLRNAYIL